MIRFIDIGEQILDGERNFAWFNTITDCFFEYNGTQVWSSWDEFVDDFNDYGYEFERFKRLYKWKNEHQINTVSLNDAMNLFPFLCDVYKANGDPNTEFILWLKERRVEIGERG